MLIRSTLYKRLVVFTFITSHLFTVGVARASGGAFSSGECLPVAGSETCIDATPCKIDSNGVNVCLSGVTPPPGGFNSSLSCWQYSYKYACSTGGTNNCTPYQTDPNCGVISNTCNSTIPESGTCNSWTVQYKCTTGSTSASSINCTSGLFDTSGFTTPPNTGDNFDKAAVAMEMMREAQVYNEHGTNIFKGVKENCTEGYGGLKNCCKAMPGAKSNSAVTTMTFAFAASAVKYVGTAAINQASPYMYDAMFSVQNWLAEITDIEELYTAGAATASAASTAYSLSAFGFTYSTGTFEAGSGLMGANTEITSFGPGGGFLEFNPYMLAAQLAIMYVASLMSCTTEEQLLAMHKGAGLSEYISTDSCTTSVAGICEEDTQNYCSFNSVLAKIINIQGKKQLGLDVSDCTGLSMSQVSSLNFKTIDFSEFTGQMRMAADNNQPTSESIKGSYTPIMSTSKSGSAQSPTQPVTPAYP